jgi:hypothetical protein
MGCIYCAHPIITRAHVKDKNVCLQQNIVDHELFNIIELCYNCHYNLFDKGKMGIKKRCGKDYFVVLNDKNEIETSMSFATINVLEEYIHWKNLKCKPRLWKTLFNKN